MAKEVNVLRRDCRHYLRYGQRDLCRQVWVVNICAEPKELVLGCDSSAGGRCGEYSPIEWKRSQLPRAEQAALAADEEGEVLEWDDSENGLETTKNELPPTRDEKFGSK